MAYITTKSLTEFQKLLMSLNEINGTYSSFKNFLSNDTQRSIEQNVQEAERAQLLNLIQQQQHLLNRMKKQLSYETKIILKST